MTSILLYLGLCFLGYFIAIPLRKYREKISWIGPVQSLAVLLLVFTMGARVGSNEDVVRNLGKYGSYSLLFTGNIFLFSILATSFVRRLLGIDRYGVMEKSQSIAEEEIFSEQTSSGQNTFTLLIALFVCLGIFSGFKLFDLLFTDLRRVEEFIRLILSFELSVLLIFVGIDMGLSGQVLENFKQVGLRVLLIPLSIIVGSLVGAFVTGLILPLGLKESMAIGAGLGWYSLGPAIMMDGGMVTGGAISFLHNLMREFFSLLLVPVVAKKIGYVEAVALPGSTAMDVCLPVVVRSTNGNIAVYSFVSGVILSAAVPALVSLFMG